MYRLLFIGIVRTFRKIHFRNIDQKFANTLYKVLRSATLHLKYSGNRIFI